MKTGGSAFPQAVATGLARSDGDGMSLRDYFAAHAMIALMSDSAWVRGLDTELVASRLTGLFKDGLAEHAYRMADAMLKARGEE